MIDKKTFTLKPLMRPYLILLVGLLVICLLMPELALSVVAYLANILLIPFSGYFNAG